MNTTELLMQYVAGQMAQSYFPQVNTNTAQQGQSDFQTMLKDKQSQSQSQSQNTVQQNKPASQDKQEVSQQEQPVEQPVEQQPADEQQQMEQMQAVLGGQILMGEAMLASGQVQPIQQMTGNVDASKTVEPQVEAAPTVENAIAVDAQSGLPQQVVQQTAPEQDNAAQEGFQLPQQQVNQTAGQSVEAGQTVKKDVSQMAEGPTLEQDVDVTVENLPQDVQQPLFQETESMPVKVGDAPVLDATVQPEEFDANLKQIITDAANQNIQRVELRLTPENLGNVVVEMTRSPEGVLHVVLHADNQNAAKLLSEHSANLGLMLQQSNAAEVRVEVPQAQQSEQLWQQPDQNDGQQQQQQQQQQRQQSSTEDFLHQIRLGLLGMEAEQV